MRAAPIVHLVGWSLLGLALLMLIPTIYGLWHAEADTEAFLLAMALVAILGLVCCITTRDATINIHPRQAFILTCAVWLAVSSCGAIPLMLIGHITYTDAFFESMSGITTTGSTVLSDLDSMPGAILLWRSLLQWVGGLGFVLTAVAILPFLGVGGMRLFQTESSEWSEKSIPRTRTMALSIAGIYAGLTFFCAIAYWLAGMLLFDAINHAMTTLATGGYSTYDASMGHFESPLIHWIAVCFMILAALPFVRYIQLLRGDQSNLWQDEQVKGFLWLIVVIILALTLWLWLSQQISLFSALTAVAFNVVSVVTTTGYASEDYGAWGGFAVMAFFYLMFVGGCSGSTSGSLKIFRLQIGWRVIARQLKVHIHPRGVFNLEYNQRPIDQDVIRSLVGFSFAFFMTIALLALLLALMGLDFITSLSAAATAVTNVGPGLGDIVGPAGNFSSLPVVAKWALSLGMLLGRLEIITVLVLFSAHYWRS